MNITIVIYLIISFFLPLALGLILVRRDIKLVILIAPYCCVGAYTINVIGFNSKFWYLKPLLGSQNLTALPVNLVFYPALGTFFIYIASIIKLVEFASIYFCRVNIFIEYLLIMVGWLSYCDGWNVYFTSITYLISYGFGYLFYKWLKKRVRS